MHIKCYLYFSLTKINIINEITDKNFKNITTFSLLKRTYTQIAQHNYTAKEGNLVPFLFEPPSNYTSPTPGPQPARHSHSSLRLGASHRFAPQDSPVSPVSFNLYFQENQHSILHPNLFCQSILIYFLSKICQFWVGISTTNMINASKHDCAYRQRAHGS